MSEPAITVRGLSKLYRLGEAGSPRYRTLRESIAQAATAPLRRVRKKGGTEQPPGEHLWALRDMDLDVAAGEVVGVIGRNGAGKSTLLKILSRIAEPTTGRIEILGRVGSLLEVGTGFHPELTGRENVFLNGVILGMSRQEVERRFDEIVAFAEVEKFLDTPVKRYSSGMYLRLAFAVAAHLDLDILIIDEVLAVGDAAFQRKCLGKMQSVAGEGRTVLFVSHNMAAVSSLCDSALILDRGRVAFRGDVNEALVHYSSSGNSAVASRDLSTVERRGGGCVRLQEMRLSSGGREIAQHICGEPLELAFRYRLQEGFRPLDLSMQLRFLDDYGLLRTRLLMGPTRW